MTTPAEVQTAALFTATDRGDCCSARATALVVLSSGGRLVFCDHHLNRHRAAFPGVVERIERHVELDVALAFVRSLSTAGEPR